MADLRALLGFAARRAMSGLGLTRLRQRARQRRYEEARERVLREYPAARPGSAVWLAGTELKYGGLQKGVPRTKVSPLDPRPEAMIRSGGMSGGDRMLFNGYGDKYAERLQPLVERGAPVTLAEFGILRGNGLAMWCDLFPAGRILGFDIDLSHAEGNFPHLESLGAFTRNRPELHEYDQFIDNAAYLGEILSGAKLDVVMDDGFHSNESILKTVESVRPHLADDFVYLIEDNPRVHRALRARYPDWRVDAAGALTVLTPGCS